MHEADRYRPATPEAFGLPVAEDGGIDTANMGWIFAVHYKAATFIDFPAGAQPTRLELSVHRLNEIARVRCVDQQGNPLEQVGVTGYLPTNSRYREIPFVGMLIGLGPTAYLEIAELGEELRRPVVFRHNDRKLAAILFAHHDARQPRLADLPQSDDGVRTITLYPAGSIVGRIVNSQGKPVSKMPLNLQMALKSGIADSFVVDVGYTNAEGRFEINRLPAGGPYSLRGTGKYLGRVLKDDISVGQGAVVDVGALQLMSER